MSTIRVARRDRFAVVDRRTVSDKRLTWGALGMLVWLLDKPDDWQVSREALAAQRSDGMTVVRRLLAELTEAGYLVRQRVRQPNGQTITETMLYESPPGLPLVDYQPVVHQPVANQPAANEPAVHQPPKTEDCELRTETDTPLPPASGGLFAPQRSTGTNPRALGTNPRGPQPLSPGDATAAAQAARIRAARQPAASGPPLRNPDFAALRAEALHHRTDSPGNRE